MASKQTALEVCPGCLVNPGQFHEEDCDHACCPDCGEQLIYHECTEWPEDAIGPDRPALWHGIAPSTEVAHTLNWWTDGKEYGEDHPVEDYTRVLCADALGQITWNPKTQRYDIGRIDSAELDRAIRNS